MESRQHLVVVVGFGRALSTYPILMPFSTVRVLHLYFESVHLFLINDTWHLFLFFFHGTFFFFIKLLMTHGTFFTWHLFHHVSERELAMADIILGGADTNVLLAIAIKMVSHFNVPLVEAMS